MATQRNKRTGLGEPEVEGVDALFATPKAPVAEQPKKETVTSAPTSQKPPASDKPKKTAIEESSFSASDFQNSELAEMRLVNSDFRQCQMSGTKMKGLDWSSCDIEGLGARLEDLEGAIISPLQAVSLAKLFGLVIKE